MAIDRKRDEIGFHDRRERDRQALSESEFLNKYPNKKLYAVARRSRQYLDGWIREHAEGRVALDYCCGVGRISLELARAGARVYGIDISSESVESARDLLNEHGFDGRAHFAVMDAEQLDYPDQTFDLVICSGVLHHLDLSRAYRELARVLKPGGRVLCLEALAHNPAIALYRRLTPHLRTGWETEHILKVRDIRKAGELFGRIEMRFFHLASIAAVPLRGTRVFDGVLRTLEAIDNVMLRIPLLRIMAWQVMFELSEPRQRGTTPPGDAVA